ncbi:ribose ABC transporter substrate-binding protein [Roseobacter denitrificans]|uniref:Ribose ABC transporter, periplasmic binding component, putative n=1 Tax=Roseobacter denitrificans (strain ATCC 33942 / OCh 114) TaxID=375451 RepID=Q16BW0_ROSDO|nr:sugar ABC transporter substrate-binding protein [Roseobacter denitrificans]ABG30533.1 ribose ABC transporter, periplasmic binding component, putative [Roseobacter denitrificans OCh 114]AVL53683.1 ribose ABC transporter substrate-binding protein [Roseobacter denitrificans]SFF73872.1 monosaccharide ABC transporter substrate-binding protein, CUT2 family [Roseobacter denitrificans OCh 114]
MTMNHCKKMLGAVSLAGGLMLSTAAFAGPEFVSGPGHDPVCFTPWSDDIKFMQWEPREGPHKVAVVNGFVGNTWRIQMIQTAKAFAEQPDIAAQLEDFKVVSTGTDVAAQLGAIEDFINQGYDAIVTIAVSPEGFDRVIRLADRNDVVVVPFDNVLDTDKVMQVNQDQLEMGRMYARWLIEQLGDQKSGKILEVRGLQGNSVDRDRHIGFREIMEPSGDWDIVEVVGNWDDGTAQKVTADAIAVHKEFDAVVVQGGTTGAVRAMLDAGHPLVPIAGESENGFRKLLAEYGPQGLKGKSIGQSPGMVSIAMKAALAALDGKVMPQLVSVPIPFANYDELEAGKNYWPDLTDNFFTVNEFPPCGVNITAREIMAKTADND